MSGKNAASEYEGKNDDGVKMRNTEEKETELAEDTAMKSKGKESAEKHAEGKVGERRVSNSTSSIYINSTLSVPDNDEISAFLLCFARCYFTLPFFFTHETKHSARR